MSIQAWTYLVVGATFAVYVGIAYWSKVRTTAGIYVAGRGVSTVANGMATAADWMSAASFISMAGLIAFMGSDGSVYLMGWTGGYVLLALLLAPFLRKFGRYTVPDFVGERYYSHSARSVALVAAIFISFVYVAGQMRGVGLVFSRFLEVNVGTGVAIGMVVVLFYAVIGGMKGITYTQVAQYCVTIFAYLTPAIAISLVLTGVAVPQLAIAEILPRLDALSVDLGLAGHTSPFVNLTPINVFCITIALMVGTAGLPHGIIRFLTVRSVSAARWSAGWALFFITLLYTTAPTVAIFAKYYLLENLVGQPAEAVAAIPWVQNWVQTASFFPVIVLGIFWACTTSQGAVAGMLAGLLFTAGFILLNRSAPLFGTESPLVESLFGITAQGIGAVGMLLNFAVTIAVSLLTPPPPAHVRSLVEDVRLPEAAVPAGMPPRA